MHDVVVAEEPQRYQKLDRKAPDQRLRNTLEVVELYELVQVHAQHFKTEHQVLPKHEFLMKADYVPFVFRVTFPQRLK